jgi:uncharacterized protein (DUF433 family)
VTAEAAKLNYNVACDGGCGEKFPLTVHDAFGITKGTINKLRRAGWEMVPVFGKGIGVRCPACQVPVENLKTYPDKENHPLIFKHPGINHGLASVQGNSIMASIFYGYYVAGDTPEVIADWYEVPIEQVQAGIDWCKEQEVSE